MTMTADYETSIKIYQTNIHIEEITKAFSACQKKKSNRRKTLIIVIRKIMSLECCGQNFYYVGWEGGKEAREIKP